MLRVYGTYLGELTWLPSLVHSHWARDGEGCSQEAVYSVVKLQVILLLLALEGETEADHRSRQYCHSWKKGIVMPIFIVSAPLPQLLPGALEVTSDPTSQAWLQLNLTSTVALGVFSLWQSYQPCNDLSHMCVGSWNIPPSVPQPPSAAASFGESP